MRTFVVPIHPDDLDLPRSHIEFATESGEPIVLHNLPIQGRKTLEMLSETLELWKPALVTPDPPESEYEI